MTGRLEVYRREDDLWDWRLKAGNGEIVATSGGQGFTERGDAVEAVGTAGVLFGCAELTVEAVGGRRS